MAETKPMTAGSLLDDKKSDAAAGKAEPNAAPAAAKPGNPVRKPLATGGERVASATETAAKPDDPSPTQAELDAMRERQLNPRRRRDVNPAVNESVEYKTR